MDHYFKGITRITIICTILGFLITGSLIAFNIKTEPKLPHYVVLVDSAKQKQDTLQFLHRAKTQYDSNKIDKTLFKKFISKPDSASHKPQQADKSSTDNETDLPT
ncbi:hypothetical protein E1176_01435 [Fulvivirga sp. RKSG066]|uniref:hypothetical protein n=1 Tax=Fulvivirga aurantia TaxID=2529383 RepID=UPI0012BCB9AA|nr:hypothetical protein [Fulvivirga aurantia]MTI19673.1 hypothetical protein [Fulvivirga aurantia]